VLTRTPRHPLQAIAAGVVGAATIALLGACGPAGGSATGAGSGERPSATVSVVTVPTADLATALGCPGGTAVAVEHRVDLPTGQPAAVVVAHCQSAAGSPPDGVYLVAGADGGSHVSATLVAARDQVDVSTLVRSGDRLRLTGRGYSSSDVPRCCPDVAVTRSWELVGDRLVPAG